VTEYRSVLERAGANAPAPDLHLERILRRRDRRRRSQRIAAGAVGIAVFLAAVSIVLDPAWMGRTTTTTASPSAVGGVPATDYLIDLSTGVMTPLPESIAGSGDLSGDYAVSPDGSKLAYVGRAGDGANVDGPRQIFVANLDGTEAEQVTDGTAVEEPAWSPDGSKIAYVARGIGGSRNVFLLDLVSGASTQITFGEGCCNGPPSFSPEGSIVYSVGREVRMISLAGAGERLVASLDGDTSDAQLSPDGSHLSYLCGYRDLCVANSDGTDDRVLVPAERLEHPASLAEVLGRTSWSPDGTRIAYWEFHSLRVFVVDVATGEVTGVASGGSPVWVDDHTLIVSPDRCLGPQSEGCGG
jgi:Tol biopolymer transport system component